MTRWSYFAQRLFLSIPVVLFGTSLTFIFLYAGPLDPAAAILGDSASQSEVRQLHSQLGLNQPLWEQYAEFMVDLLTFNLGSSWVISPDTNAVELVIQYAPRTVWMGFWAVLIPLFIGIPLGFYAGLRPNTWGDYLASFGGIVWRAMPNFWLAVILMTVLSRSESALFGFDWKSFLVQTQVVGPPPLDNLTNPTEFVAALKRILPASLVLGSASMGNEMRIGRTAMLENVNSNYVEMAKAKGLPGRTVVWKHVFRNALIPLVPVITAEAAVLVGGSVIIEYVFSINGLYYLFFQAMVQADIPLAGVLMFIFILLIVVINITQDFLYTVIDPRVGYEGR